MNNKPTITNDTIFYHSFGYDATIVKFFQVVRIVSQETIEVREIRKKYETPESVTPDIDNFCGEIHRIRRSKYGGFKYFVYEGRPLYQSASGTY